MADRKLLIEEFDIQANHKKMSTDADDFRTHRIQLIIQLEALAQDLGRSAVRNKSGKAVEVGGLVRALRLS